MSDHEITLTNRGGATFTARAGQPILEAAEAAGVPLPFGCRFGSCRLCAARLVAGKVAIQASADLDQELLNDRIVLLCVTTAQRDCSVEVGDVRAPLLPAAQRRPWTE